MALPKWAEKFNITQEAFSQIVERAEKQHKHPAAITLEEGKINETKFMRHEQEVCELPSLREVFFNAPPPMELWKELNFEACRSHGALPVAQWETHVIWAKMTSDPTPIAPSNSIFVLAPYSGISRYLEHWERHMPEEGMPAPFVEKAIDVPAGLKMDPASVQQLQEMQTDCAAEGSAESPENTSEETETSSVEDIPAGLSLSAVSAPVKIDFSMPSDKSAPQSAPIPRFENTGSIPVSSVALKVFKGLDTKIEKMISPDTRISKEMPSLPRDAFPEASVTVDELADVMEGCANQEELADLTLRTWLKIFDKSMLLLHQDKNLFFWRWAGDWTARFNAGEIIPLDTPSIFKIVADTHQPYHGHANPSPVNDQVFSTILAGAYPEHVTVVPVVVSNNVVVMILGICSKMAVKKIRLDALNQHAQAFSRALIRYAQTSEKKAS